MCCALMIFMLAIVRIIYRRLTGKPLIEVVPMPSIAFRSVSAKTESLAQPRLALISERDAASSAIGALSWWRVIGCAAVCGFSYTVITTLALLVWSPIPIQLFGISWCEGSSGSLPWFSSTDPEITALVHFLILESISIAAGSIFELIRVIKLRAVSHCSLLGEFIVTLGCVWLSMSLMDHHIFHRFIFSANAASLYWTVHAMSAALIVIGFSIAASSRQTGRNYIIKSLTRLAY